MANDKTSAKPALANFISLLGKSIEYDDHGLRSWMRNRPATKLGMGAGFRIQKQQT
jgi:hypothetical protein